MSEPPSAEFASPRRFSVISAVYNVHRYLGDFLGALERQSIGFDALEVILVDDGSTDDSLTKLREFASLHPGNVTVIHKENGGQASARNAGLDVATGEWVTFIDPDDWIDDHYFASVDALARQNPNVDMLATNRILANEARDGSISYKNHALAAMFSHGDRVVDLSIDPSVFHGSAPSAFLKTKTINEHNLRFDTRLRTNFEDGHFCVRYLDLHARPKLGFVASALYYYRRRSDGTSTLQINRGDPCRYVEVPRIGFLGVLEASAARHGQAAVWLQNMILYELSWYFGGEEGLVIPSPNSLADREYFLESLRQIRSYIQDDTIYTFRTRYLKPVWRLILLHSFSGEPWARNYAVISDFDAQRRLVKLTYVYNTVGPSPVEKITSGGEVIEPEFAKRRAVIYFGAELLTERIVWVRASGPLRIFVNDVELVLQRQEQNAERLFLTQPETESLFGYTQPIRRVRPVSPVQSSRRRKLTKVAKKPLKIVTVPARRIKGSKPVRLATALMTSPAAKRRHLVRRRIALNKMRSETNRSKYARAILLMDRVIDANDSAEHLFTYLRNERPELNTYFVLSQTAPEWQRLKQAYGDRVLDYGSVEWYMAWTQCILLASSHADIPIINPHELRRLPKQRWSFFFLQHGVTKDDLSNWLNPKPIAGIVTSTPDEQQSMVGDGTAYTFTNREARMTGLPRFDRLQAARDTVGDDDRRFIIVAPTWRQWLVLPRQGHIHNYSTEFAESEFATEWSKATLDLFNSDPVQSGAVELVYLPHPNLAPALHFLGWPAGPRVLRFDDPSLYDTLARCHVLVTDYSSMAFNAAFLERQVLYFQFDHDRMMGGDHVGRQGYFNYQTHGFGPVAESPNEIIEFVNRSVERGGKPEPLYAQRMEQTFPNRDGRCSERAADFLVEIAGLKPAK